MKNLVIFASGSGSNAENIIRYFATKPDFCVKKIYCNVPGAYVLERARQLQVPACVFTREEFRNPDKLLRRLQDEGTDFIVLAGFLWLVPPCITAAYPNRIVNIHPALLPAYGGKGMYGHHVHEARTTKRHHHPLCQRPLRLRRHHLPSDLPRPPRRHSQHPRCPRP